ncbi:S27A2 synthetase, partial [Sakesphorus luctuosus]|nr:S27A2 synthetase [Sakesphorus luctuosus]
RRLARCPPCALLEVFQLRARSCPGKPFLLFQDETFTYGQVDAQSTRLAWALWHRCAPRPAQVVAVFMPNSPAYVWTWLALAKLGCAMACVNSNARGAALCHALRASGATVVIVSPGET